MEGIQDYAVDNSNMTKETVQNKTVNEIIDQTNLLKCFFSRDELFTFFIIRDGELAYELKRNNSRGELSTDFHSNGLVKEQLLKVYHYSNENAILSMANNDFRAKHNIDENVIILTPTDFDPSPYFLLSSISNLASLAANSFSD